MWLMIFSCSGLSWFGDIENLIFFTVNIVYLY
jgi:hypothetical protein